MLFYFFRNPVFGSHKINPCRVLCDVQFLPDFFEGIFLKRSQTEDHSLYFMQKMPEIQRMVFSLRALEEYSFKEIGQELNITENTARVYFMRAKNWITEEIK